MKAAHYFMHQTKEMGSPHHLSFYPQSISFQLYRIYHLSYFFTISPFRSLTWHEHQTISELCFVSPFPLSNTIPHTSVAPITRSLHLKKLRSGLSYKTTNRATFFMAKTSTSTPRSSNVGSSSSSPMVKLAEDHLFTILLLLPVDSLISFAMTCKRFRSLTTSDTLWESICRREWGSTSVDAFKSSINTSKNQQLPWMRLYKQVSQLDSFSCHKLPDPDRELMLPTPRASHSLNFVSDCLVLFGGGCEGG